MRSQLTIYLAGQTGIDANGKGREGFRVQAVQGSELNRPLRPLGKISWENTRAAGRHQPL
jgi:hypothetical protein